MVAKHRDPATGKWSREFLSEFDGIRENYPQIMHDVRKAEANGLHITERTRYLECALLSYLHGGCGLATMMIPPNTWEDYLEELLTDPDNIRVGLDEALPMASADVSKAKGDAARGLVMGLADSLDYEVRERPNSITVIDDEGDIVVACRCTSDTKPGAWSHLCDFLDPLM